MQGLRGQVAPAGGLVPWEAVAWTLRMAVAVVLLYASADKIVHPQDFAAIVRDYRLLPDALVNVTALWLPWFELVLGVCLFTGWWGRTALLLSTGLLGAFFVALIVNYFRGINVACGCFSSSAEDAAPMLWYMGRDALLLCLPLAAWEAQTRAGSPAQ